MEIDDVDTVAVLGAGNMGHGIAELTAMAGFRVMLRDISEELVQEGYENIEWSLGKLVEQGRLSDVDADAALDHVTPVVDLDEAVSAADVVIEAVPERMDIKREVYDEVEAAAPDHAVFATNTSSLSITELSAATDRPERFCGMHFFNPPVRMPLVEVIAGAHTDEATLDLIEALAEEMGKTPVRVHKDSPGFIVNRILVPLLNEAAWLVHDDEASMAAVDSTTKFDMGLPMGAFELTDQVGIDIAVDVLDYLNEVLGAAYEPCPLLEEKIEAGDVGKKAGAGFYDYENGGVDIPSDAGDEAIQRGLVAVMANEVAKLIAAEVADAPAIDEAVQLGAGFPDGPAAMADAVGLAAVYDELEDLHAETGEARYEPAALLADYADAGRGFYPEVSEEVSVEYEAISVEADGRVGRIALDRPHRLNTITEGMLDELEAALDSFEHDDDVRCVLLSGAGDRAFSAGVDFTAFGMGAPAPEIVELSRKGQRIFGLFEASSMPVVAAIDGYCLAGGMELAICADLRVATERSEFGQTEHNVGFLPGWGGTQRLRHLIGESRAKEIIFTAERFDAETMDDYGFVNDLVPNGKLEAHALELARDLAAGPPLAQRYTKRAMRAGRDSVEAGLEIEAEGFGILSTTDDLVEGVTAFLEDRDPEFEGK